MKCRAPFWLALVFTLAFALVTQRQLQGNPAKFFGPVVLNLPPVTDVDLSDSTFEVNAGSAILVRSGSRIRIHGGHFRGGKNLRAIVVIGK